LPSNPISLTTTATANLSQAAAALRATAILNEERAMERQKSYNDLHRKAKPSPIEIGDIVLLKRTERHFKSEPLYEVDPYTVTELIGTMATIEQAGRKLARHVSLLKVKIQSDFWETDEPSWDTDERQPLLPVGPPAPVERDLIDLDNEQPVPNDNMDNASDNEHDHNPANVANNNENGELAALHETDSDDEREEESDDTNGEREPETEADQSGEDMAIDATSTDSDFNPDERQPLRRSTRRSVAPDRFGFRSP
jgi:hypothetical protein